MKVRIAVAAALLLALAGSSTADAKKITGKNVKNGSLTGRDIKNGSIKKRDIGKNSVSLNRLSPGVRALIMIKKGTGTAGPRGPRGPAGPRGAAGGGQMSVTQQGNGFTPTNSSVKFTGQGAKFGPYADNNSGGSVQFTGYPTDTTLADIATLEYSASGTFNNNGDGPYLRVFTKDGNGDEHDVIFSPSTQLAGGENLTGCIVDSGSEQCGTSGRLINYKVTEGSARYDDDGDDNGDSTWDEVINAHQADKVTGVYVSVGRSQPGTSGGTLNSLKTEFTGQAPTTYSFSG